LAWLASWVEFGFVVIASALVDLAVKLQQVSAGDAESVSEVEALEFVDVAEREV
jgi:hypothetical protein